MFKGIRGLFKRNTITKLDWFKVKKDKKNTPTHVTVPAPKYLEDDVWFGPATLSEKQLEYKKIDNFKKAKKSIHQVIYEIATKTKVKLGGSENFIGGKI